MVAKSTAALVPSFDKSSQLHFAPHDRFPVTPAHASMTQASHVNVDTNKHPQHQKRHLRDQRATVDRRDWGNKAARFVVTVSPSHRRH
jgi:hypothetical protein